MHTGLGVKYTYCTNLLSNPHRDTVQGVHEENNHPRRKIFQNKSVRKKRVPNKGEEKQLYLCKRKRETFAWRCIKHVEICTRKCPAINSKCSFQHQERKGHVRSDWHHHRAEALVPPLSFLPVPAGRIWCDVFIHPRHSYPL